MAGTDRQTSLTLLERARNRDEEAWQRLLKLYAPLVASWCGRWGVSGQDADDVSQDVFGAVAAGLATFRRDRPGDTFRGWLRGITRNQVLLHARRNRGRPRAQGGDDAWEQLQGLPDPVPAAEEDESGAISELYYRALEGVRAQFEERTWQAFWLTAIEGRSPDALSAELGMSPAGIRQARSRVLRRLKEEVGDVLD